MECSERAIRYVCTSSAHVRAPVGHGTAIPYGSAQAWCPSSEAADHEFLQIKDTRSRIAELTVVLAALRTCQPADSWDRAEAVV